MSEIEPNPGAPAPGAPADGRSSALVLLVSCPDRPGLVAATAQALFAHGANILDLDQHTDPDAGWFFQRIRFAPPEDGARPDILRRAIGALADRYGMDWRLTAEADRKRVVIFVSRADHCLWDLLLRHAAGELPCEIPLVVSNHADLAPVAAQFGVRFEVVPVTADGRAAAEARQQALLAGVGADVVILARYMQVLSDPFVAAWPNRIINIHHSFLPAFQGSRPYHQAHERGAKLTGATAHYVTTDLDEGPIIDQDVIRSSHRDSVDDLIRKGRDVERTVLARAVRWHLEDRILVHRNRTIVFA